MASMSSFIRNTPAASLRAYFDQSGIKLPVPVNWDAPQPEVVRPLLRVVDDIDDVAGARMANDAERVTTMVDEAGQAALDVKNISFLCRTPGGSTVVGKAANG